MMTNFWSYNSMQWFGLANSWWFWPLMVWSVIWKGLALWKAAKLGNRPWFIALLVINTAGILEIFYIFFFSKSAREVKE